MEEERMRGGFSYYLDSEKIREYMKISPKDRLIWLKEANEFLHKVLPPEKLAIWAAIPDRVVITPNSGFLLCHFVNFSGNSSRGSGIRSQE